MSNVFWSLLGVLQVILIILKFAGVLTVGWVIILIPAIIWLAAIIWSLIVLTIVFIISAFQDRR